MFIPKWRLTISSARSSGPGGQNVNKTETKIELRFVLDEADWIPEAVRRRFAVAQANRINKAGEFILSCEQHRSQGQNLREALEILSRLLDQVAHPPKKRIKTKATKGSQRRRLDSKSLHGAKKRSRRGEE